MEFGLNVNVITLALGSVAKTCGLTIIGWSKEPTRLAQYEGPNPHRFIQDWRRHNLLLGWHTLETSHLLILSRQIQSMTSHSPRHAFLDRF